MKHSITHSRSVRVSQKLLADKGIFDGVIYINSGPVIPFLVEDSHLALSSLSKNKLMVFSPGTARDILPRFQLYGEKLEVAEETKLLGLVIRKGYPLSMFLGLIFQE